VEANVDARLTAQGISKAFGTTQALDSVDFEVRRGEIHALLGENGAGKSTLVRILTGALKPDEGALLLEGAAVTLHTPQDALAHGIVAVHQELSLMPNLTVAENVCLASVPTYRWWPARLLGIKDGREMRRRANAAAQLLHLDLWNARVENLSPAQRQLVEIVRALAQSANVVLLDEPTSSLPPGERRVVFERLDHLRAQKVGVVFITHLLEEALDIANRITVLRDGRNVGTRNAAQTNIDQLVEMMTGRQAGAVFPKQLESADTGSPRLEVKQLASAPEVNQVTFKVYPGEIVGLAGLVGSGRTETLKTLFGLRHVDAGEILLDGKPTTVSSPREAIRSGIAYIPEDRHDEGLFADDSIERNICIATVNTLRGERVTHFRGRVLDARRMRSLARGLADELQIKRDSLRAPISSLSGGNQQKAVLARWLAVKPSVILADEPTRGVAISSKIEIYRLLRELAAEGVAVVFVSSEFEELVGLCSRVVLLRNGVIVGETGTADLDADALLNLLFSTRSPESPAVVLDDAV
jgi:ABC-type sugar transport system ATPase subunit